MKKTTVADAARAGVEIKSEKAHSLVTPETSGQLAETVIKILQTKRAKNIVSVKVDHLTVVADYFIIASGTSSTAVKGLAQLVDEEMSKLGIAPSRTDGIREGQWAALDFGTVIVHIFLEDTRNHYQLEKLWTDGTNVTEYND